MLVGCPALTRGQGRSSTAAVRLAVPILFSTLQQPWLWCQVSSVPLHVQPCLRPEIHEETPHRCQGSLVLHGSLLMCPSLHIPAPSQAEMVTAMAGLTRVVPRSGLLILMGEQVTSAPWSHFIGVDDGRPSDSVGVGSQSPTPLL